MTPKEKANELIQKYYQLAESIEWSDNETMVKAEKFNDDLGSDVLRYWNELAKKSALLQVDEIIELLPEMAFGNRYYDYFKQVKHEIELL